MVSRRNFISITIIIFVILFMFQLSGVVKENWNDYTKNPYADENRTNLTSESTFSPDQNVDISQKDDIIYIGAPDGAPLTSVVKQWGAFTKRRVICSGSLDEVTIDEENPPQAVLLDAEYVDWSKDIDHIETIIKEGVNVIFCSLPPVDVIINNDEIKSILGISYVSAKEIDLTGIKLFNGFLLGGEEVYIADDPGEEKYQDLCLNIPWYYLGAGTKTYMVGLMDEKKFKDISNEALPAIIWRNSIGDARIFAVNGDYLFTNTGIGILDAMMAEMKEYEIYPIVNAQSMIILNYPVLTAENDSEMMKRYSRTSDSLLLNIIWPGLITLSMKTDAKITHMMNLQLDYEDDREPNADRLQYYFKLISEQKGEVGLSDTQISSISLKEKLKKDDGFLQSNLANYEFTTFYSDQLEQEEIREQLDSPMLKNIRTILMNYDENGDIASYLTNNVLAQRATIDGYSHTFSEDLRVKSLETALGYSAIIVDMKRILYPETETDGWEYLYNDFSRFTTTYWKKFTAFDQTTLSQSDKRIRELLAMDYTDSKDQDTITLQMNHFYGEGWFILRTHNEKITSITGGEYQKIEDNAFLILANQNTVQIRLEDEEKLFYSYE